MEHPREQEHMRRVATLTLASKLALVGTTIAPRFHGVVLSKTEGRAGQAEPYRTFTRSGTPDDSNKSL